MLFSNTYFRHDHNNNEYSLNILQNSYAIETDDKDKVNNKAEKDDNQNSKETDNDEESDNNNNIQTH